MGLLNEAVTLTVEEPLGVKVPVLVPHWVEEVEGVIVPLEELHSVPVCVVVGQGERVGVEVAEAHPLPLPLRDPLGEVRGVGVEEGHTVGEAVPLPHKLPLPLPVLERVGVEQGVGVKVEHWVADPLLLPVPLTEPQVEGDDDRVPVALLVALLQGDTVEEGVVDLE